MADPETFDAFYRATYDRTLRYMYAMVGDHLDAQDLTQEAYGRAWRRWRELQEVDDPEAWVRTVAWRAAANFLRHLRIVTRRHLSRPAQDSTDGPDEDALDLVAALKKLDPGQRQVLVLYYLLDLPVEEVAREMGASVSAIKARLVRGRMALAALMSKAEDETHVGPA